MKTILITNDDGIDAKGLERLAAASAEFGRVWVVAPDGQRSAASHCISLHRSVDVIPYAFPLKEIQAFSCSGTPADCVRIGILHLLPSRPDLLLSGINFGYNIGPDIQYSGTVGAAFEAERYGVPAIAVSEGNGEDHRLTDQMLPKILRMLIDRELSPGQIFNVNFPQCSPEDCRGILENRTVSRDPMYRESYKEEQKLLHGGVRLHVNEIYQEESKEGTDFRALTEHFISVSVLQNICHS